jgi:hypothetical protein
MTPSQDNNGNVIARAAKAKELDWELAATPNQRKFI